MEQSTAAYETKEEAFSSEAQRVRFWLQAIEAAGQEEKDWRKDGADVINIYRSDDKGHQDEFNILHSNVETMIPAAYNSTPKPDVRRRYGDRDPIAKTISDLTERAILYSIDAYDFDAMMNATLFDGVVPGRGIARVRYMPYLGKDGNLAYQEATCEYVPWRNFRRGPGRTWDEVPWIAFELFPDRDGLKSLTQGAADKDGRPIADLVNLDCSIHDSDGGDEKKDDGLAGDMYKRARVWEIWDKDKREVLFIATGYTLAPLRVEPDPLGLTKFYPIPRPLQPIMTPGKLTPVAPYTVYRKLAEELNLLTLRIKRLVRQIRVRGIYRSNQQDLQRLAGSDDGELVPVEGLDGIVEGLDKAVAWWPIDPQVKALAELYRQREAVKQTIYEVTGLSDILRGQSVASETATAQNIKNQWGSLRIQRLQAEVQRFARDLFQLKSEIIGNKFTMQNLALMTGIPLLPQQAITAAQQQAQQIAKTQQPVPDEVKQAAGAAPIEQIEPVMRNELIRGYRVDIESDSTIRGDLTRSQEQMTQFLNGTALFIKAVGPAVQTGQMPQETVVAIYSAFARHFKLGKQAEDALAHMEEVASQPKPPKPDPEAEKAKQQMALEQQKMQMQQANDQAKLQIDAQSKQQDAALAQQKMQNDMMLAQQKADFDMQLQRERMAEEFRLKHMELQATLDIKRQEAAANQELARQSSAAKFAMDQEAGDRKAEADRKRPKVKENV